MSNEARDEETLQKWIAQTPGLAGWAQELLDSCGVRTIQILAEMSQSRYTEMLNLIPMKRIDHPEDLWDGTRKADGHLNSLDELRKQAQNKMRMKKVQDNLKSLPEQYRYCMDGMLVEPGSPRDLHDVAYDGDDEMELAMGWNRERDLMLEELQGFTGLN